MKQRLLALGAGFAILGSLAASSAVSFPDFTDFDTSGPTDVADPDGADLDLGVTTAEIAADGDYHKVNDVFVGSSDPDYTYTLVDLNITNPGAPSGGTCGSHDYSFSSSSDVNNDPTDVPVTGNVPADQDVNDLYLAISPSGTLANCQISGGEVTATFQIP